MTPIDGRSRAPRPLESGRPEVDSREAGRTSQQSSRPGARSPLGTLEALGGRSAPGVVPAGLPRTRVALAILERGGDPGLAPAPLAPPQVVASAIHDGRAGSQPFVEARTRASLPGLSVPDHALGCLPSAEPSAVTVAVTDSAGSNIAARQLTEWLRRRPKVESAAPLAGGGRLNRYVPGQSPAEATRSEALYAGTPGIVAAVLTVHRQAEVRTGVTAPTAAHVAAALSDPPVGLLTGVWQSPAGASFRVHNNRLHVFAAPPDGASEPGHWRVIADAIATPAGAHERMEMLGQQADREIYARLGSKLLRLGGDAVESLELGAVQANAVVRVGADGVAYALHDGELRRIGTGPAAAYEEVARPIGLLRRANDDPGEFEPSPAVPKDFLLHGEAGNEQLIVLDQKGRMYEADPGLGGPIDARRLALPDMGRAGDWAVTAVGRARDGSLQALCEHKDGHGVALQRPPGAARFEPAFHLDQPMLLVSRQGLHAPSDEQMGNRINFDGHSEFATHLGVVHFRESPDHPWAELLNAQGQPHESVQALVTGQFGFVDRKPVFALVGQPAAVIELKLEGRTTVLPATVPPQGLPGGPLAVVPSQVRASRATLLEFGDAGLEVRAFAVDKQKNVYLLEPEGRILSNRPGAAMAGTAPPPLRELHVHGLERVLGIALGGDNHLHALDAQANGRVLLKRMNAQEEWKDVPIDLSDVCDQQPQALRVSRTGQIELQLEDQSWHALLPAMTDANPNRQPRARLDPQPIVSPPARAGINAGTNETIDRQGPARLRVPTDNHDLLTTTALLGNTSTDPLSLTSNLRTLRRNTRSHAGALARSFVDAFRDTFRAAGNALGYTALRPSQFERLKTHFHLADRAHQQLRALLDDDRPRTPLRGSYRGPLALSEQSLSYKASEDSAPASPSQEIEMTELQHSPGHVQSNLLSQSERVDGGSARIDLPGLPAILGEAAWWTRASTSTARGHRRLIANATRAQGPDDAAFPAEDLVRLIALRETTLQGMLTDLRKIGIKERALEPTFEAKKDSFSASTTSYGAAEAWRGATRKIGSAFSRLTGHGSDILPGLERCFMGMDLASGTHTRLSSRERTLVGEILRTLRTLMEAGVQVSARPAMAPDATIDGSTRDQRDPHGIRSASLAHAMSSYDALLQVADTQALQAAQARAEANGPHKLSKLGLSSWVDLEAFDDVVASFRDDMSTPHSARRQQLLKSMGLPADAAPDQMAARMGSLLQDLYNRSTFFSVKTDGISVGGTMGPKDWQYWNPPPVSIGGTAIHALGVERIGDSKDEDAGLVAFFVRHAQASGSISGGLSIDLHPGKGTGTHPYAVSSSGEKVSASWSAAATLGRLNATGQHGVGAAVLLSPETIPEFARLLFDVHDPDTTKLLSAGWNEGAIGLDLFETNLSGTSDISVSANALDTSRSYGTEKRSSAGFSAGGQARAFATAHAHQMELHLDHGWSEILGLEYQGSVDLRLGATAQVRAGGSLSTAFGTVLNSLTGASTGLGSLQIAAINVSSGDANPPFDFAVRSATTAWNSATGRDDAAPVLGTATYKRTLDVEAAESLDPAAWTRMTRRLAEVFPAGLAELGDGAFPALPSERIAFIDQAIERIQGRSAVRIQAGGAFDGRALRDQHRAARAATHGEAETLWLARSASERAGALDLLKQLRQQETFALRHRARVVPGCRIELNLLGRESLDMVVTRALGHQGLGGKMAETGNAAARIPGLADVMKRFKGIDNVNQVRFVFEMRPQAIVAINDALALREQEAAVAGAHATDGDIEAQAADGQPRLGWREVLDAARSSPDLYRLAVIAPHNTDDNPSSASVGTLGLTHSTSVGAPHQLFQAEVQFRYGLYDDLVGVEVLEGGHRALAREFDGLRGVGLAPVTVPPLASDEHFGPASPTGERVGLAAQRERFEREEDKAATKTLTDSLAALDCRLDEDRKLLIDAASARQKGTERNASQPDPLRPASADALAQARQALADWLSKPARTTASNDDDERGEIRLAAPLQAPSAQRQLDRVLAQLRTLTATSAEALARAQTALDGVNATEAAARQIAQRGPAGVSADAARAREIAGLAVEMQAAAMLLDEPLSEMADQMIGVQGALELASTALGEMHGEFDHAALQAEATRATADDARAQAGAKRQSLRSLEAQRDAQSEDADSAAIKNLDAQIIDAAAARHDADVHLSHSESAARLCVDRLQDMERQLAQARDAAREMLEGSNSLEEFMVGAAALKAKALVQVDSTYDLANRAIEAARSTVLETLRALTESGTRA